MAAFPTGLPTDIARSLAIEWGIHCGDCEESDRITIHDTVKSDDELALFQQMAMVCNFEESISAFGDRKFKKKQRDILKLIHESTNNWIAGHVAGVLLGRLSGILTDSREANEIAKTILLCSGHVELDGSKFVKKNKINTESSNKKGLLLHHNFPKSA